MMKYIKKTASCKVKNVIISLAVLLAIPAAIYAGTSIYIGTQVYDMVQSSFDSKGMDYQEYTGHIGRISYQRLDYSQGRNGKWRVNYHTFPIVKHDFNQATAYYTYTIEGDMYGGVDIPVTLSIERRDGEWYITDVSEPC